MLPNLLVIGAQKCGTSSLHHYLDQHPDIAMSKKKEPHFFNRANWQSRLEWYESLFVDAPIRGESSPNYTNFPIAPDVPDRIRSLLPDAKLVYLVGDPLKRIVSHWVQAYSGLADLNPNATYAGKAGRPLIEGLEDYSNPYHFYVARSRYATQLEQYLKVFPASQILVLDQAELRDRPLDTMREAFSFLGVDPSFDSDAFSRRLNVGSHKRRQLGTYARVHNRAASLGLGRLPEAVRGPAGRSLRRAFSRPVERPDLDPGTIPGLTDLLAEEADRLRTLTGRPFAKWSV